MSRFVELEVHTGINLVTQREQTFNQYMVFVCDGDHRDFVGILGFAEGSKVVFTKVVDPITSEWVRTEVSKLIGRDAQAVECPDIPQDLLDNKGKSFEQFDEEDLVG